MTISPPLPASPPVRTPLARTGSSIVRCGRCGSTQSVDLTGSVLTQVRPFVHAHLACGPDAVGAGLPR
jgi:hypothetical protein